MSENSENPFQFIINNIKFLVSYTLILISGTWAVFTFTLGERAELARIKLEEAQAKNSQYEAQIAELNKQIKTAGMKPAVVIAPQSEPQAKKETNQPEFRKIKKGELVIDEETGMFITLERVDSSGAYYNFGYPNGKNNSDYAYLGRNLLIENLNNKTYTLIVTAIDKEKQEVTYLLKELKQP